MMIDDIYISEETARHHLMTPAPIEESAPYQWLTVSQAAARLGISERTVQRRCKAGKLRGKLVPTDEGQEWRVDPLSVVTAPTGDATVTTPNQALIPLEVSSVSRGDDIVTTTAASSDDTHQSTLSALLEEKDAHIYDLREQLAAARAQIEAHARSETELRAALREALKLSIRALPEASSDATHDSE